MYTKMIIHTCLEVLRDIFMNNISFAKTAGIVCMNPRRRLADSVHRVKRYFIMNSETLLFHCLLLRILATKNQKQVVSITSYKGNIIILVYSDSGM